MNNTRGISHEVLLKIENIEQNLKMIDNIFKCMDMYWQGDTAQGVQNLYRDVNDNILQSKEFIKNIKASLGSDNIKKLSWK